MAERGRKVYTANGCYYCHTQQVRPDYDSSDIDRKWGDRRSAPRDYIFDRPVLLGRNRMGPDLSNIGKRAPADDQAGAAAPAAAAAPVAAASPAAGAAPSPVANAPTPPSPASATPAGNATTSADVAANGESTPPIYSAAWHYLHLYSPRTLDLDSNMPSYRFLYQKRRISGERSVDALNLTGDDAPPAGFEVVPTYEAKCLVAYLMSLDQSHALKEVKSSAPASPAAPATK